MPKKKTYKSKSKQKEVKEPLAVYGERRIHVFKSFEEQESYQLAEMAKLSSEQIPNNLPKTHTIKIIQK